jgi:hypothetical protein
MNFCLRFIGLWFGYINFFNMIGMYYRKGTFMYNAV